ncbi:TetR/AcrR family transcriptional regulator [Sphingopyxis witflariensis]|uniref:TetR family transcriptional regulator n=1 Tax=Sphingopyxis witflariensis TaxID=173675 RepID=A0A2D0AMX8_9SPHN|nr:TetR/AcrR family transcriptional regulator [Sphingopyxis witflariensis]OWQ95096.1 TetR family transcriptional regulator [Sphingopyxis witflariensis]
MIRAGTRRERRSQADRSSASELKLLSAAALVLVEEGYSALTFDRIGEVSGFSRGLASQKFGSKDGMVLAVVDYLNARLDSRYAEGRDAAGNPLDEVIAYVRTFLEEIAVDHLSLSYFVLLAATIANKAPTQPAFVEAHQKVKKALVLMIERGQKSGIIRTDVDPETAALSIGSFQLGVATQLRLDPTLDVGKISRWMLPAIRAALEVPGRPDPD